MVIIANPIYDTAFKRLMENERAVRFLIGTLLNKTVVEIIPKPQEFTRLKKDARGATIFRMDFNAVVKTKEGELQNVLIEIQKAWKSIDLMRFRNYIAEQYKMQETVDGKEMPLPIVTIYILGFNLPDLESSYTAIERQYWGPDRKPLPYKSNFVEKLTHNSYVVQVQRINGDYRTRLEKLLSLFEQTNFVGGNQITKEFDHPIDDKDIKTLVDILQETGSNPEERKDLQDEQEALRSINALLAESDNTIKEKDKVIEEKDKVIEEKDKENEEKDKVIEEKDKVIEEKDKALAESKKLVEESKKLVEEKDKMLEKSIKALEENEKLRREVEDLRRKQGEK